MWVRLCLVTEHMSSRVTLAVFLRVRVQRCVKGDNLLPQAVMKNSSGTQQSPGVPLTLRYITGSVSYSTAQGSLCKGAKYLRGIQILYSQVWMEAIQRSFWCRGDLTGSSSWVGFDVEADSKHLVDILSRRRHTCSNTPTSMSNGNKLSVKLSIAAVLLFHAHLFNVGVDERRRCQKKCRNMNLIKFFEFIG